jgi:hypothetical protein
MERFNREEDAKYRTICGAVAWPGKKPGFAVIVGQKREPLRELVCLDEAEDSDMRELIRACGGFDYFYRPDAWLGDTENRAARQFMREMNAENRRNKACGRAFALRRSPVLDITNTFDYIYPTLKKTLAEGQLILKESKLKDYMLQPQADDLSSVEFGDYPAIEALAFAALELERVRESRPRPTHALNDYQRM